MEEDHRGSQDHGRLTTFIPHTHDDERSPRDPWLQLRQSLHLHAHSGVRAQCRLDLASARGAGGARNPPARRQCGGCGHCDGRCDDAGRAGQQRSRQRRVLHPLGRAGAAWPQCLRLLAGSLDAGIFQAQVRERRQHAAAARYRFGDRARRGRELGRAFGAFRQAAVRGPAAARDRDRRARLPGDPGGAAEVGGGGFAAAVAAGIRQDLPAVGAGAEGWRAVQVQDRGAGAEGHCRDQGRCVLQRRDRRGTRKVFDRQWRQPQGARPFELAARVGCADQPGLRRPHAARDSAERPGHRGLDRARHPQELRHRIDAGRLDRLAAPADRGHEAGLRRYLPLCVRPFVDGCESRADARCRLSRIPCQTDRLEKSDRLQGGQPGQGRHHLPHRRRRERHDGELHPEQLHGLRLGLRRARLRHQPAEPRLWLQPRREEPERGRAAQAALPHHHPGFPHQGRRADDELRRDGRQHAAAGPHADAGAHARLRPEPTGRLLRAEVALQHRHGDQCRIDDEPRDRAGPRRHGAQGRRHQRFVPGLRRRTVHLAHGRPGGRRLRGGERQPPRRPGRGVLTRR
ncbi:hypothetical protein VARIO8X_120079 [Burkholderiales bacterium 8X]|nr:hypothetical protein VARIO8X_120079 [Burkholderiales bacterium 8X]